jgi:hypothetical protein
VRYSANTACTRTLGLGDVRLKLTRPITPPNWLFRGFGLPPFRERVSSLQPPVSWLKPPGLSRPRTLGRTRAVGYIEKGFKFFIRMKSSKIFAILVLVITCLVTLSCSPGTHKWQPETVLIYYAYSDLKELPPPIPYKLILYADGQMFLFPDDYNASYGDYIQILTKKLTNKEICALLNTIDQVGFFNYDPSTYKFSTNNQEGLVTEYIQVNSWRSKSVNLYGLGFVLEFLNEVDPIQYEDEVDKVMVDTYNIINYYPRDGFEIYQPEKLAVWAVPLPDRTGEVYSTWPLETPSLAEISRVRDNFYDPAKTELSPVPEYYYNPGKSTILQGSDAQRIYNTFEQSVVEWGLPFSEDGIRYMVMSIPLLPYQSAPPVGDFYASMPTAEFPSPPFSLTCKSSDGLIEIPMP